MDQNRFVVKFLGRYIRIRPILLHNMINRGRRVYIRNCKAHAAHFRLIYGGDRT